MHFKIEVPKLLNPESIALLHKQMNGAEQEGAQFLVLTGIRDIFCAGLDLHWVTENADRDYLPAMKQYHALLKKLQTGKFISIAIINGEASGGGMGLVCACDYVIAETHSTFSLPEGLLGLIPGMILPSLLNRLKPPDIKKMIFTGKKYNSAQSLALGICDEVVDEKVFEETLYMAINNMKSCKRDSVGAIKELLYDTHLSKDEYAKLGMKILSDKLNEAEIAERLQNIAAFMKD